MSERFHHDIPLFASIRFLFKISAISFSSILPLTLVTWYLYIMFYILEQFKVTLYF